jgi:CMP/dCMP kinase
LNPLYSPLRKAEARGEVDTITSHAQQENATMSHEPFVITISHQIGSGGANLGKTLSERLNIPFVDREILIRVAQQLNVSEQEVEGREERLSSFWESFSRALLYTDPVLSLSTNPMTPSDKELFNLESEYIARIAETRSAIILGRCGRYILRDHPRHIRVFVHAALPTRIKRISELYHLLTEEAARLIETNDRERAAYIHTFTRQDWLDSRLYDLSIDTSRLDFDSVAALVLNYVKSRFGDSAIS